MDLREVGTGNAGADVAVRHPWEQARARLVERLVRDHLPLGPRNGPVSILDIGSGDGWLAAQLAERLGAAVDITCVDAFYDEPMLARLAESAPRNVRHCRAAPDREVDWVLALDVVEHVADDRAFVADMVSQLRPQGRLIVTVPAHQWLFGPHDVALGHHRRYAHDELVGLLRGAHLAVDGSGELFSGPFAVRAAQVKFGRRSKRPMDGTSQGMRENTADDLSDEYLRWHAGPRAAAVVAGALRTAGRAEIGLARRHIRLPGLSVWASARRPIGG